MEAVAEFLHILWSYNPALCRTITKELRLPALISLLDENEEIDAVSGIIRYLRMAQPKLGRAVWAIMGPHLARMVLAKGDCASVCAGLAGLPVREARELWKELKGGGFGESWIKDEQDPIVTALIVRAAFRVSSRAGQAMWSACDQERLLRNIECRPLEVGGFLKLLGEADTAVAEEAWQRLAKEVIASNMSKIDDWVALWWSVARLLHLDDTKLDDLGSHFDVELLANRLERDKVLDSAVLAGSIICGLGPEVAERLVASIVDDELVLRIQRATVGSSARIPIGWLEDPGHKMWH